MYIMSIDLLTNSLVSVDLMCICTCSASVQMLQWLMSYASHFEMVSFSAAYCLAIVFILSMLMCPYVGWNMAARDTTLGFCSRFCLTSGSYVVSISFSDCSAPRAVCLVVFGCSDILGLHVVEFSVFVFSGGV